MAARKKILVVDDEPNVQKSCAKVLGGPDRAILLASSAEEALEVLAREDLDVVVTDIRMPGMDGLALLREIRSRWPEVRVVIITGFAEIRSALAAVKAGAFGFVPKPYTIEELSSVVERALSGQQPESHGWLSQRERQT